MAGVDFTWLILILDLCLLIVLVPAEKRTNEILDKKSTPKTLKTEQPISWLKGSLIFSVLSMVMGVCYFTIDNLNLSIISPINFSSFLLFFTLCTFGLAVIYTLRATWFLLPHPKNFNVIKTGHLYSFGLEMGIRGILLSILIGMQGFNGATIFSAIQHLFDHLTILGFVYIAAIIVSFVVMFPLIWRVLFQLTDKLTRRDLKNLLGLFLPWIILAGISIWLNLGAILI